MPKVLMVFVSDFVGSLSLACSAVVMEESSSQLKLVYYMMKGGVVMLYAH